MFVYYSFICNKGQFFLYKQEGHDGPGSLTRDTGPII